VAGRGQAPIRFLPFRLIGGFCNSERRPATSVIDKWPCIGECCGLREPPNHLGLTGSSGFLGPGPSLRLPGRGYSFWKLVNRYSAAAFAILINSLATSGCP